MNWKDASAMYLRRLNATLQMQSLALGLARIPAAEVPAGLVNQLTEGIAPIEKQRDRLRSGQFRIAVVGLEKAGKSTFVNAWLQHDLLPSDQKRCTFTTTQVLSLDVGQQERLEIDVKSREEFARLEGELRKKQAGGEDAGRRAGDDLKSIERHRRSLEQVILEGNQKLPFSDLSEITKLLRDYVADESRAHAVKEARVYTQKLASTGGIVFFDVPGLNSGLAKHLEESREMLSDCDAVICIQDSQRPSLEAHEKDLIRFAQEGDKDVGLSMKLFVFGGKIDKHATPEAYQKASKDLSSEWRQLGVPEDRIVMGSAGGHLLLVGAAGTDVSQNTGDKESLKQKLVKFFPNLQDEVDACGVRKLNQRVETYLENERVAVLAKRCDEPLRSLLDAGYRVYDAVSTHFSEDPEDAKRQEEGRREIAFGEWWDKRWVEIEAQAQELFRPEIDNAESVTKLKERYEELVTSNLDDLPSRDEGARKRIFASKSRPVFDSAKANAAWREALHSEVANLIEKTLAEELSLEIFRDVKRMLEGLAELLWGTSEIERRLLHDPEAYRKRIATGLRTLFLRFARPAVEATIRGPVASQTRKDNMDNLGTDIELLDNYYEGSEVAYESLKKYAKYGWALLKDEKVRIAVLGVAPRGASQVVAAVTDQMPSPTPAVTPEDVVEEVNADVDALKAYLLDAVFSAAGFRAFRAQELQRLWDLFVQMKGTWDGVVRNEHRAENTRLLNDLPQELKGQTFDVEVSEQLRQLRLALEKAESACDPQQTIDEQGGDGGSKSSEPRT